MHDHDNDDCNRQLRKAVFRQTRRKPLQNHTGIEDVGRTTVVAGCHLLRKQIGHESTADGEQKIDWCSKGAPGKQEVLQ